MLIYICFRVLHCQEWRKFSDSLYTVLTFWRLLVTWCTNSLTFNNCTFCPHCIYVFCIYLRTNSNLGHLRNKLIGFYNRDEKCLLRGMNWVFKWSGLSFIFKGFIQGVSTICTDQLPTFHVFRKAHSMLVLEFSAVYHVVSQVLIMERHGWKYD